MYLAPRGLSKSGIFIGLQYNCGVVLQFSRFSVSSRAFGCARTLSKRIITPALLVLLTVGALAVHGYHPYAEDAEIYLPGIEKLLHPDLFPSGTEFFESHAGLTLFPNLIALSVRITHLPFEYALFAWSVLAIFLFLLACWEISGICFQTDRARWGAVALTASLLTLPIAGTALYIMDQYLNPRNLAAFAGVFAVCRTLQGRNVRAAVWILVAALVHPLMWSFTFALCGVIILLDKIRKPMAATAILLPFANFFAPPSPEYREAMRFHISHFLLRWQWYEWLGIFGPIAILFWFGRIARARQLRNLERLCHALIVYEAVYFAIALIVAIPERFEAIARLQPMRSLLMVYIFMLIAAGGLLAEYFLKSHLWRWGVFFLPLCAGMFLAQRGLFPASAHIEWPWAAPKNPWAQAFLWIRENTPATAQFALDPFYMQIPGEDTVGFRALAQRSRLADASKDSGAVAMFPPLAQEWWEQFEAQKHWKNVTSSELAHLHDKYGVTWAVLQQTSTAGTDELDCPFRNQTAKVCRLTP